MSAPRVGTRFSAEEMHDSILEAAEEEMERPASELLLSGLAAGLGIGFSFLAVAFLTVHLPDHPALAKGLAYPLGFVFVVLARHQLFTENTLEPVIPVLERRDGGALRRLVRLWSIVLPANLLGTAIFGVMVARTPLLDPAVAGALHEVAREATEGGALLVFYKAIWAGWLVALMAWLLAATRDTTSQILIVWLTTAPIAALGFKHSIAGAAEAFYRVSVGEAGLQQALLSFELPALAGNVVGGVVLVALLNHGQAKAKHEPERSESKRS
jgi:formate/nitrite transporter FocA (FNT family)